MGTGTLYGSIKRMMAAGLIEEAGERPDPALDDERRRYYRMTEAGASALGAGNRALRRGGVDLPAAAAPTSLEQDHMSRSRSRSKVKGNRPLGPPACMRR